MGRRDACLAEIPARLDALTRELGLLREAFGAHVDWHRDTMTAEAAAARARRVAARAVWVSAVSALAAVAGVVIALAVRG